MKHIHPLVLRCLTFDPRKIAELTDKEFLTARQELGTFGIPIEQLNEARRQLGPVRPVAGIFADALADAVAESEVQ